MGASTYVFQLSLTGGNGNNSLGNACYFGFLFHIGSAMLFDLEMETKRFDVRQEPMRGFKKTAQMSRYQNYTGLLPLPVKLLHYCRTYR
ncbi:hypothetical protein DTO271D3_6760 [Paecilomyces variotii]|nr:hypothetical protein DTO169C6_7314 [Paecilomyces variotii]KAJ9230617.1 hypothetical protein DTO169E5_8313 [Paecilomyces variotii]KAJ9296112.1 hypothetical protein DTO217A2_8901 [Paecilomyces variotii]KAJ9313000.1 hypothetical protein DTO271D3_6760 [Paecilomyces variotii]KAJ9322658.1 hypothetical protein DTO027B3_6240 [Paecilomyces variotii]